MIKEIKLENFFSFKDTTINFQTNNSLLLGINGAGKSNLFRALEFLKAAYSGNAERQIIDIWGGLEEVQFAAYLDKKLGVNKRPRLVFTIENLLNINLPNVPVEECKYINFQIEFNYYDINTQRIRFDEEIYLSNSLNDEKKLYIIQYLAEGYAFYFSHTTDNKTQELIHHSNLSSSELRSTQIKDPVKYAHLEELRNTIKSIFIYHGFDTSQQSKIRSGYLPTVEKRLLSDGSNLVQIINTIKNKNKEDYKSIIDKVKEINPHFEALDHDIITNKIELTLQENGLNRSIHVSKISDGTLKYLCLLSIIYNENRGKVVCIEEPETGLHPDMISGICDAIQEKSNETQFIITTHSDIVVNRFKLEDIIVLEKDEDNASVASTFTEEQFKDWYEEFFPGQMWLKGDIGGTRW